MSGGPDGTLRVWNSSTRAHEAQFSEHKGKVTQVLIDMVKPNLVHSCGEDKTVITVDLRVERRVTCHSSQEGQFQNMVQLATSENELLTCDHGGSVKFWDCDVPEPVSMIVTIPPNEMESTRERRLTHLSLSKGDKYLLASTAAGEVQVCRRQRRLPTPLLPATYPSYPRTPSYTPLHALTHPYTPRTPQHTRTRTLTPPSPPLAGMGSA